MGRLRTLHAVGAVCLAVVLSACGGSDEPTTQAAETPEPQSTPSPSAEVSATPEAAAGPATRGFPTIALGSADADGRPAAFGASEASLSADGNFLAYRTPAVDASPTPAEKAAVFVRDLRTGSVVSACTSEKGEAANGDCRAPTLSRDGQFVAFESTATNLVPEDKSPNLDVFRKDLRSGAIVLVSSAPKNGGAYVSGSPSITGDGNAIAFVSEASLDPAHPNPGPVPPPPGPGSADPRPILQVYVKNLTDGTVGMVSRTSAGKPGDANSTKPKISADGSTVVFGSVATNIAGKPRQGVSQVLVARTADGQVSRLEKLLKLRLSKSIFVLEYSTPTRLGGRLAYTVGVDPLDEEAGSSKPGTAKGVGVFVADLNRGTVVHTVRTATGQIDDRAGCAALSADGKLLAYCTFAKKRKGMAAGFAAYVAEVDGNTLRLVSAPVKGTKKPDARPEAISENGGVVVFRSDDPQRGVDAETKDLTHQLFVARPAE
ncbi:MAG: hypothetical protein ACT4QG_11120 [Sporichthyaceae bacterium]